MRVLHTLLSRPNITSWIFQHILESGEYHVNQLTENGDSFRSDELSSWIVKNVSSKYASFDIQTM